MHTIPYTVNRVVTLAMKSTVVRQSLLVADCTTYDVTITILDIIHRPVFYLKLNSTGLSVPHRKHITSPLRAHQVNAIYRIVTMVY
jgi:hypothetical protein